MVWTLFWDMHSGGGGKEKWDKIYIEAPQEEAEIIFYNRFGHNPNRVTCTCCGEDYSIDESETLERASAYHRNCRYVYRRPDGTECDDREGFEIGKGRKEGYTSGYEESQGKGALCSSSREYMTVDEYEKKETVLVIREDEIKADERTGELPEQGYVWVD